MRFALLFLLGTAFVLVEADDPVLVCRDDQSDDCECDISEYILEITCLSHSNLNTTNIIVPDSVIKDVTSVKIVFAYLSITQLTKPFLSSQLSDLVVELVIADFQITEIDAKLFDNLPKLESLEIIGNIDGETLNSGWLTPALTSLKYLTLKQNGITKIPSGSFNNLKSLEQIDMTSSNVNEIEDLAFDNLPALKILYLSRNNINKISSNSFGNLPQLAQLYFDYNQISEISNGAFKKIPNLGEVFLDYNNLKTIPDSSVFAQPNKLVKLILHHNKITQIAKNTFDGFDQLENLEMYSNQIETIGIGELDGMKKINKIDLSLNVISKIDDGAFDSLVSLAELDLGSNDKLSLTDGTFGSNGLVNLESLDLSRCNLKTIANNLLKSFPKLKLLNLDHNQLTSVPLTLRDTKSLAELHMSFNNITSIDENAFGKNPSLKQIYLEDLNELKVIGDCAFCGLTGLTYVILNKNNKMEQINENAFGFATNLADRAINMTQIHIQDGGLKTVFKKLLPWDNMYIDILGNPANCDPSMDWLFRNKNYNLNKQPTYRYYDRAWCEGCKHDDVCQKMYGWSDLTTKPPRVE